VLFRSLGNAIAYADWSFTNHLAYAGNIDSLSAEITFCPPVAAPQTGRRRVWLAIFGGRLLPTSATLVNAVKAGLIHPLPVLAKPAIAWRVRVLLVPLIAGLFAGAVVGETVRAHDWIVGNKRRAFPRRAWVWGCP
jgi:hypothetical protein